MKSPLRILLVAGAAVVMFACATDNATSPLASSPAAAALISAPVGFSATNSSFVGGPAANDGFVPGAATATEDNDNNEAEGENNNDDGPGFGEFMGGGVHESFIGGLNVGGRHEHGAFGEDFDDFDNCAFSSTSNRVDCPTVTDDGLTINRSFSFLDAAGVVQQTFDPAKTNTVNIQRSVSGTVTHHQTATSTVTGSSDLTIAGLASGSTQRTVNGKSAGTEATTGTKDGVAFTASRAAGDTTTGLVIPIQSGRPAFPTAGTIIRAMQATVTLSGQTPSTSSRREVITFDGSSTAKVVITQNGVTKNCTKPLPHGELTCQ